jgi:hypothetical protein
MGKERSNISRRRCPSVYKRDLKNIDFHLLDTGHFALEEDYELVAELISNFLRRIKSIQA